MSLIHSKPFQPPIIDRLEIGAKVVDRIVRWLSPLVFLALILLTVREARFGPTPEFVAQMLLGVGMVATAYLGRRLRPSARILIYSASLFFIGLVGIAQWGLMGSGLSVVVFSLIVFSLMGLRRWLVALGFALLGTFLAAVGWVSGLLPLNFDPAVLMRSIQGWGIALVSLTTAGIATLIWEGLYSQLASTTRDLRESEERYLTIFNTIHQALLVHDLDGRVLDLNQSASQLFGISREKALQMTISADFTGPGSPVEDLPGIWQRVIGGEKIRLEWNARRPGDRTYFPAEVWLEQITLAGSRYVLANLRDLTEQKQANEEISQERYFSDTLLESVPGMFYLYEIDEHSLERSRLLRYNRSHMLETGYTEAEMSRMTLADWFEPQALPDAIRAIQLLDVDPQNQSQLNLRKKDGSVSPYAFTGRQLKWGSKNCFLGIGLDVSDYVLTQTALQQERDFSNSLIEGLPGVFCMIGPDEEVTRWNHRIEEVTGYSRADLGQMSIHQIFDEVDNARVREMIAHAFMTGKDEIETALLSRDGQSIPYYFVGWRKELDGQPYLITFGMDITRRKQAEVDLREANRELEKAYIATLQGWAQALELRERETADHSRRVVDLTLRTAKAMGFEGEQLVYLERGALLHDIGKMGVPDNILLKPEPLTSDEWVIMRQHADYAWQLIQHIDFLRPSLAIPYCHHEHWDGSGYPRKLRGEEIPLEARIFTIVDVYDALCSKRPYRPAWNEAEVLRYLVEQRGQQFDPRVVDVFLEVLKEI